MSALLRTFVGARSHDVAFALACVLALAAIARAFARTLAFAAIAANAFDLGLAALILSARGDRLREKDETYRGGQRRTGQFDPVHRQPPWFTRLELGDRAKVYSH